MASVHLKVVSSGDARLIHLVVNDKGLWAWGLSQNHVAVDLLLETLEPILKTHFQEQDITPERLRELHAVVTSYALDHLVHGDPGYECPNVFTPDESDLRWIKGVARGAGSACAVHRHDTLGSCARASIGSS